MPANNERFRERTVKSEGIYSGRIIQVELLTVTLPNGNEATREVVHHPGAVGILAQTNEGKVLTVRQWRMAIENSLLEIPAGKLEPGEDPKLCAERELQEETGFTARNLQQVAEFYTSPGFANEKITLFYATGLASGVAQPDEDEFLDVEALSRREVQQLVQSGAITDAKTLIAFQWWLSQDQKSTL